MNIVNLGRGGVLGALALMVSCAQVASAAVVGGLVTGGNSGGSFQLISPPASIGPDLIDSPDVFAFDELQDVVLTETLQIGPNRVAGIGSVVSSHYIVFDPAVLSTTVVYIDFDDRISALIRSSTLDTMTDTVGLDSILYAYTEAMNTDSDDVVMVDPDNPNRLILELSADSPGDHLRILTGRIQPVPEPASLLLLSTATAMLVLRRRRVA